MKINLILSSEEIEQLIHTHILNSGFDVDNKELDIEFVSDGEEFTAIIAVEDSAIIPKPKRTRRTREQMEADANAANNPKPVEQAKDAGYEDSDDTPFALSGLSPSINNEETSDDPAETTDELEPPKTKGIFD
jgi:hypothetical protein